MNLQQALAILAAGIITAGAAPTAILSEYEDSYLKVRDPNCTKRDPEACIGFYKRSEIDTLGDVEILAQRGCIKKREANCGYNYIRRSELESSDFASAAIYLKDRGCIKKREANCGYNYIRRNELQAL